jgi:3-phosphoshikimate 1-carboxyvinyltransferase
LTVVRIRGAPARGRLSAPPSKSYTHRALVAGHLARRRYRIERPLDSDDTRATANGLRRLGTEVRESANGWTLAPTGTLRYAAGPVTIDCGESGTTLRFLAAAAALQDRPVLFRGKGRLPRRPMRRLVAALRDLGATCRSGEGGRSLPLLVRGPIHGGRIRLDASESSQFASALLLALPTLAEDSELRLTGPVVSRPYLDATLAVLAHHGVRVRERRRVFAIPGGQAYARARFSIPGDASSAAYLWVAAVLSGGDVEVRGIPADWPQADLLILRILEAAGALVRRFPSGARVSAGSLRPFTIDLTSAPDLYPLAGVLAALAPGTSVLKGAAHVALKESDRRRSTTLVVRALGGRARVTRQGLRVEGTKTPRAFDLRELSDHRLVMSAAVAALAPAGTCRVGDAGAVRKSFPGFWDAMRALTPEGTIR